MPKKKSAPAKPPAALPALEPGPWALFLGGKWVRERPNRAGTYPVATREGAVLDMTKCRRVARSSFGLVELDVAPGEPGWQGWWWSHPIPIIPKPCEEWT